MKTPRKSGGARLVASGKKPVLLGLDPADHLLLSRAANAERRPLTQFLLWYGLQAAKRVVSQLDLNRLRLALKECPDEDMRLALIREIENMQKLLSAL